MNQTKITVTTVCDSCYQKHTSETYLKISSDILILKYCDKCKIKNKETLDNIKQEPKNYSTDIILEKILNDYPLIYKRNDKK